jgi:hypothetical protein
MKKVIFLLITLALVPAIASAGSIVEKWTATGSLVITVQTTDGIKQLGTKTGWTDITVIDAIGMDPLVAGPSYEAYCVDLFHWSNSTGAGANTDDLLHWNLWDKDPTPLTAPNRAAAASWLLNYYVGGSVAHDNSALQIAIWEVLYETGTPGAGLNPWNPTGGSVSFSDNAFNSIAQGYLDIAFNSGALGNATGAIWIVTDNPVTNSNGYYQDFATVTPVPEPGSLLFLGSGMIGLAAVIGRRPKK